METQALPSDLAGVLALFSNAGTSHGVCDVPRVGVLTLLVLEDGDVGTSPGMGKVHCRNDVRGYRKLDPFVPLPHTAGLALNPVPVLLACSQPASLLVTIATVTLSSNILYASCSINIMSNPALVGGCDYSHFIEKKTKVQRLA